MSDKLQKRTIKHKAFTYFVEVDGIKPDGTLGRVVRERMARRGEVVELSEADIRRGESLGAFYTEAELKRQSDAEAAATAEADTGGDPATPPAPEVTDISEYDADDLSAWIRGVGAARKPSIPQVLAAVNAIGDEEERQDVAEAVKEAEESIDGRDPRASLVEELDRIIEGEKEEE